MPPIIATTSPCSWSRYLRGLSGDLGKHTLDAHCPRRPLGRLAVVAAEKHRRQPESFQPGDRLALVGYRVRHDKPCDLSAIEADDDRAVPAADGTAWLSTTAVTPTPTCS